MGMSGPCVFAEALGAFEGGEDCVADFDADGAPSVGACPQAGIAGTAIVEKTISEKTTARQTLAINKIRISRFIQVEGVGACKQNCSVSRGIPARSCEYPQLLGCTNRTAGRALKAIFVPLTPAFYRALPRQNRASIHVEDLSGDESSEFGAQEQYRGSNFLGPAGAPQRNRVADFRAHPWIFQRRLRHVGINPSRSNAIHVNAVRRQFRREALRHADDRALARGIVAMKGLATLSAGGTDQHDVTRNAVPGGAGPRLRLHLRHAVFHQPK